MSEQLYFKTLNRDRTPHHGGIGKWKRIKTWMPPVQGKLVECSNGYHLCTLEQLRMWLGPAIYLAEWRGECLKLSDKIVVREARLLKRLNWNKTVARNLAADCAEHVLHIFESRYPDDERPRRAKEAARSGAAYAAYDAAKATAYDAAAKATAYAAYAAYATAYDAAAKATANAAAIAAANIDEEKQWQNERLLSYLMGEIQ